MRAAFKVTLAAFIAAQSAALSAQVLKPQPLAPMSSFKLPPAPQGQFAPRALTFTNVKGDLWRAGDGTWFMGVLVTPDGILLVDTLNVQFATWLKQQLAERFPGKPVK